MRFIRHNWVAILVVVAVLGSYLINRYDVRQQNDRQRVTLIQGCQRTSARTALTAAGEKVLAARVRARGAPGDEESANQYNAIAEAQIALIPAPAGREGARELAEVYPVLSSEGRIVKFRLSAQAARLQREGCERVF